MNLNVSKWKPFITARLFPVLENGKANQQMLDEGNNCFYVGAKRDDNGVMIHCIRDESLITKGNCIVFICNGQGSVGYANYMDVDFLGTTDIVAGYNEFLNPFTGAFLASVYSQERPKYSFGRKWKTHLKETEVNLPVKRNSDGTIFIDKTHKYSDEGFVPDWQFMENYIKSLHHKPLTTKNKPGQVPDLNVNEWKYFLLKDICVISMGNKLDAIAMTSENPEYNFVGRSEDNNGVSMKVDAVCDDDNAFIKPYPAGCITVALGGSLGSTYLQKEPFYTSQNVSVLQFSEEVSDYAKLFICALIHNESLYKYFPFGRELNTHIRKDFGFTLPVKRNSDGTIFIDETHKYSDEGFVPDWQFMEDYIKALPYGDRLEG